MDVTLEMSALAFLEQAEVKELVRPSQQSWLDSSRPTLISCSRVRPYAAGPQSIRIAVIAAGGYAKRLCPESIRPHTMPAAALPALLS